MSVYQAEAVGCTHSTNSVDGAIKSCITRLGGTSIRDMFIICPAGGSRPAGGHVHSGVFRTADKDKYLMLSSSSVEG